ncbi:MULTISPECIES: hypothetical protein [unclassified Moorena]|uniref:hypothetical protein n=2 Tax=Moorena TaxID=1155738 RepID=UPI00140140EA|nr:MULTISPECIES: hypothetical protein [unclassified Moorena]NEO11797.1 hypothetical protein [Moorena sp. SIO3E8]NEP98221.1 hypothetical protein [Moorena sp. SIO3F7]
MTGKVIDSSATGILILIIPFALVMVLLLKAWPIVLAMLILIIIIRLWQQYQWQKWTRKVNPFFNQLIKDNQGCLTPIDLSIKADISGTAAKQYLEKKAQEFGAQSRTYDDIGTVYYFLTASALGSIFDESEPSFDPESESSFEPESESNTSKPTPTLELKVEKDDFSTSDIPKSLETPGSQESVASKLAAFTANASGDQKNRVKKKQDKKVYQPLIQAELAKRLDVHSSTVGKRKSDPDFSQWSQSKDPDGIAWEYSSQRKEFLPVVNN